MALTAVILGMHRSGTSCVARMLNACGLYLGDDLLDGASLSNMEGKWESRAAVEINDSILAVNGGAWDQVPEGALSCDGPTQERMRHFLETLGEAAVSGWKDPRTVLTFPMWKPLLGEYRIVACVRHPMSVAESLATREGWPIEKGLELWKTYHERFRQYLDEEREVTWFDFDLPSEHLARALDKACRSLGLRFEKAAGQSFNEFQRHHRHEQLPSDERLRELYLEFFYRAHRDELGDGAASSLRTLERPTRAASSKGRVPQELDILNKRLADLGSAHRKQNSLAQRSFKATQENTRRVTAVETALGEASRATGELGGAVARLEEQLGGIDRAGAELRGRVAGLDERLPGLDERFAGVSRAEGELRGTVAGLEERVAGVSRAEGELRGTVAGLEERLAGASRSEGELRATVAGLEARLEGVDRAGGELRAKVAPLEERLEGVIGAERELRATVSRLDERVEALAQRLQGCEDTLARKPQTLAQWLRQRLGFGPTGTS
ncbi:MAG: hypothetical protein DMF80_01260 [Acidobacteria bacterium]|nr:MAG: hypothetical protein DMF80_01260 [Acidobacteriota bacterium]